MTVIKAWTLDSICPAQFMGLTDDGRHIYARYRFGCLRVYVRGDYGDSPMGGECVHWSEFGDQYAGSLLFDDLREATPKIDWPELLSPAPEWAA